MVTKRRIDDGTSVAENHPQRFSLHEAIFLGIMASLNVVVDLLASTILKFFLPHAIAGIFVMVPVNFMLMSIARLVVDKAGTLAIYLTTFGVLSIPTPLFGGIAGPYKIVVGLAIGLLLDATLVGKWAMKARLVMFGLVGAVAWWVATYTIWQLFGLPFVTAFSNMFNAASASFNGAISLSGIFHLPITGFGVDFLAFAAICGLFSAGPVLIGILAGYKVFLVMQASPQLARFRNMK
ncbi:MAG: hypothetical protein GYA24_19580 [Candidatus Lokiarchaeota archaeon]|nr:hypothetical protein [Candidatus Lokiarchaeota archaeon]